MTINVFGTNFSENNQVKLGSTPLETVFIDSTRLYATIPAGVAPGSYDVTVFGQAEVVAAKPFTVMDSDQLDDLSANPIWLWVNPAAPDAGHPLEMGMVVDRLGRAERLVTGAGAFLLWRIQLSRPGWRNPCACHRG